MKTYIDYRSLQSTRYKAGHPVFGRMLLLLLTLGMTGCVQSIELELDASDQRVLVVEGQITNLNQNNYVRLTRTRNVKESAIQAVGEALITITSDRGEIDTLVNDSDAESFDGYYYSTKAMYKPKGVYTLKIDVDNEHYMATSAMPSETKIDSIRMGLGQGVPGKYEGNLPFIFFREAMSEKNYYMTRICVDGSYGKRNPCPIPNWNWGFLLLDDLYLPLYVKGININVPNMPSDNFVQNLYGDCLALLYGITPEAYYYYQSLLNALKSDGGVYSPTPSNQPTNITGTGKVAGFFNVASVSFLPFYAPLN